MDVYTSLTFVLQLEGRIKSSKMFGYVTHWIEHKLRQVLSSYIPYTTERMKRYIVLPRDVILKLLNV